MLGECEERKEEGSDGAGGPGGLGGKPIKVSAELFSKSKHGPVGLGEQAGRGDGLCAAQLGDVLAKISSDDSRKSLNTLYLSLSVTHTLDLEG